MFTFNYKGWWIHETFGGMIGWYKLIPNIRIQSPNGDVRETVKSLHAAKCRISRYIRKGVT